MHILQCTSTDIDGKVCKNLELTFEEDREQKAYGGEYEYIGTVKLNDKDLTPFYKQKDHPKNTPLTMYHNGNNIVGTVNIP